MSNPVAAAPTATQPGSNATTTVVVEQPTTVLAQTLGPAPICTTCPSCTSTVTTSTSNSVGAKVWITCGIICLIGLIFPFLWLGCCLIPFCIPAMYSTKHACPNCGAHLGTYQ